ncbi:MAG TPA: DUF3310 domain-containing protein [Methanomassiliicoccaceae archaeon]|nr:DUF3310 domain-containing protein [Methanomassiliicoccaceae archaeon]
MEPSEQDPKKLCLPWVAGTLTPCDHRDGPNCGMPEGLTCHFQGEKKDVAHQQHYEAFAIQPIEYIRNIMSKEAYEGYLLGNVLKYVSRFRLKNGLEDLQKAQVYLGWLIESMEGK